MQRSRRSQCHFGTAATLICAPCAGAQSHRRAAAASSFFFGLLLQLLERRLVAPAAQTMEAALPVSILPLSHPGINAHFSFGECHENKQDKQGVLKRLGEEKALGVGQCRKASSFLDGDHRSKRRSTQHRSLQWHGWRDYRFFQHDNNLTIFDACERICKREWVDLPKMCVMRSQAKRSSSSEGHLDGDKRRE
mmetsp:Transcript_47122/g.112161  ORF Transcript_47122/g.112161 Transcript_47122/m.112161 type:complete len:193 (-) Transcript_47122:563-1141(-)